MNKILFVVAHPDDESLWAGGTLSGLSQFENIETYVLCITGRDDEHRCDEFKKAMEIAKPTAHAIMGHDLPKKGGIALEEIPQFFNDGLIELGLELNEIDLVITHPHYGDEHTHMNHMQLFYAMREITAQHQVPFACFSFMPIPYVKLCPILPDARRDKGLHLISIAMCELQAHKLTERLSQTPPRFFVQFKVDEVTKREMLNCYQSINTEQHQKGYSAWDSYIENFYIFDEKGLKPFIDVYGAMSRPYANGACIF
jgi:LmbE family N-acetylglucosaminyl deacetylase